MSNFAYLLLAGLAGYGGYKFFFATPTPKTGGDYEELPGSTTSDLTIEQLVDKTLAQSDVVARLGGDKASVRASVLDAWYKGPTGNRVDVSAEAYALARNVELDGMMGTPPVVKRSSNAPVSAASASLLIDVSDRFAQHAFDLAPTKDDQNKVTSDLKEIRRTCDEAAAKGSSTPAMPIGWTVFSDSPAGSYGAGGGSGGPGDMPPYYMAMEDFFNQPEVKASMSAKDIADSKAHLKAVWDSGSTQDRADTSNELYGASRHVNFDVASGTAVADTGTVLSPRANDDLTELSDLFVNHAMEMDPSGAPEVAAHVGAVRATIDATAAAAKVGALSPTTLPSALASATALAPKF